MTTDKSVRLRPVRAYRTDLPNSVATRISARTPALSSHPSSINTTISSHRSKNARADRSQNAHSLGKPCWTNGCE